MVFTQPITLGDLIKLLEKCDPSAEVRYDFMLMRPTTFDSYRGFYDQLALGYEQIRADQYITVGMLLARAKDAVGNTYYGWKSGEYTMTEDTPVWVGNRGEAAGTAIVNVFETVTDVILMTQYID